MILVRVAICAALWAGALAQTIPVLNGRGQPSWLSLSDAAVRGKGLHSMLSLLSGQPYQRWALAETGIVHEAQMWVSYVTESSGKPSEEAVESIIGDTCARGARVGATPTQVASCVANSSREIVRAAVTFDSNQSPGSHYYAPLAFIHPMTQPSAGSPSLSAPVVPRCLLAARLSWDPAEIMRSAEAQEAVLALARPGPEPGQFRRRPRAATACASGGDGAFRVRLGVLAFWSRDVVRLGYVTNQLRRLVVDTRRDGAGAVAPPEGCGRWSVDLDVHVGIASGTVDGVSCTGSSSPSRRSAAAGDDSWQGPALGILRHRPARPNNHTLLRVAAGLAEACPGGLLADSESPLPEATHGWPKALRAAVAEWRATARGSAVHVRVWAHAKELARTFAWSARERTLMETEAAARRPHVAGMFEEDHRITAEMLRAHWEWSAFMPAEWTPGVMQLEENWRAPAAASAASKRADLPQRLIISGSPTETQFTSIYVYRGVAFAMFEVVHQGGFALETERRWPERRGSKGCLSRREQIHWFYGPIEGADSGVFFRCGLVRAVPLPMVEDANTGRLRVVRAGDESWGMWAPYSAAAGPGRPTLLESWRRRWQVHHLPNKYLRRLQSLEAHLGSMSVTDEQFLGWASMCKRGATPGPDAAGRLRATVGHRRSAELA